MLLRCSVEQGALVRGALAIELAVSEIADQVVEAPAASVAFAAWAACAAAVIVVGEEIVAVSAVPVVPGSVAGPVAAPARLDQ